MTDDGNEWLHLETGRYMSDAEVYRELDQRTAPREPGEAERELFHWEQKLKALARDAYDEIESTTANTDVKHGANRGVQALARRVLKELAAPRPDAGDGTGEPT